MKPINQCYYFGTFNPVHNGHLAVAETIREKFKMDKVIFVPAFAPPHKKDIAAFDHRVKMLELAGEGKPYLGVSRIEETISPPTYTVKVLKALWPQFNIQTALQQLAEKKPLTWLQQVFPRWFARPRLPFILGNEQLAVLETWKDPKALAENLHFLVMERDKLPPKTHVTVNGKAIPLRFTPVTVDTPVVPANLSSTKVRQAVAAGQGIDGMVPPKVAEYIRQQRLYLPNPASLRFSSLQGVA